MPDKARQTTVHVTLEDAVQFTPASRFSRGGGPSTSIWGQTRKDPAVLAVVRRNCGSGFTIDSTYDGEAAWEGPVELRVRGELVTRGRMTITTKA